MKDTQGFSRSNSHFKSRLLEKSHAGFPSVSTALAMGFKKLLISLPLRVVSALDRVANTAFNRVKARDECKDELMLVSTDELVKVEKRVGCVFLISDSVHNRRQGNYQE